jgi:nitrite reductase/ring-hydroxylating ferredoxin subunit
MTDDTKNRSAKIRDDFVPASDYISKDFLQLENERLWPRAWLMACRQEELDGAGSYLVFDIVRESILLVRQTSGEIKAFYNVCQHRGRRLKEGCGHVGKSIYCRFHGWSWNVDGSLKRVVNREEWDGCAEFGDEDLRLPEIRVETWGGWVFVNMDPETAPLREYLGAVPQYLDCYELDKTRLIWSVQVTAPVNWKLVLDAFNEGYHVEATHPQTVKHGSTRMPAVGHGLHAAFGPVLFDETELPNRPAALAALQRDPRELIYESITENSRQLRAMYLEPNVAAARRVLEELPPGTDVITLRTKLFEFNKRELTTRGVEWPKGLTPKAIESARFGWHIFPNFIVLLSNDGTLCYRTRPHPENPDECVWDIWAFGRFAPGAEPKPEVSVLDDYQDFFDKNEFLYDDLVNMPEVQKGMYSRGFRGARTNPDQEKTVSNFHRSLHDFIRAEVG